MASKALRRIAGPVALTLLLTPGFARAASFDLIGMAGSAESAVAERTAERGVRDLFLGFFSTLWDALDNGPQLDPNGTQEPGRPSSTSTGGDNGPQLDPNG